MTVYDIDHATLDRRRRGSAVPEVERQPVPARPASSQAARIVSVRLREELGGITAGGVEARAADRRSGPRCSRSTPSRGWSAR